MNNKNKKKINKKIKMIKMKLYSGFKFNVLQKIKSNQNQKNNDVIKAIDID